MPTLHMLLVVKRGRSETLLEGRENEVLGMLVDEAAACSGEHQLSMLLSLPSFPEDSLASKTCHTSMPLRLYGETNPRVYWGSLNT